MKKQKITIKEITWILFTKDNGWTNVKILTKGEPLLPKFRAINIDAALHYIWRSYKNRDLPPIQKSDLREWK